ncbi:MAG: Ig-like domain-containing protein [Chloroflexota bacterium]
MNWKRITAGVGGLLVVILTILFFVLRPVVVGFGPEIKVGGVSRFSPIEITFSREMRQETVEDRIEISPSIPGEFIWDGSTLRFEPDAGWSAGTEIEVSLGEGGRSQLGLPLPGALSWTFGVAPVQLAYLWPAGSSANIYMMDLETGEASQLTVTGGVISFTVNPDGLLVYYFAENSQGGTDLLLIDRFEGEAGRVMSCQRAICSEAVISPDGEWLAYQRGGVEIWALPLTGGGGEEIKISTPNQTASFPAWSADGLLSFYDAEAEEFNVVDLEVGETITSWPNQSGELGVWAPGGNQFTAPDFIEYETDLLRGPTGEESNQPVDPSELDPVVVASSHLQRYSLDSSRVADLTEDDLVEDYSPAYSPNGQLLAFTRRFLDEVRWTPGRQVWLISASGGQPRQLTNAPDYEYSALSWHPDGRQIAAVRFNVTLLTEQPEIWLLEINGAGTRLVINGYAPQWVP